jgi:hypothetical protein
MHGDKKWIRDYSGRLKRSNDRTWKDWQGDGNRSWEVKDLEQKNCPDCKARKEELGRWVHPRRWDYTKKESYFDMDVEYFYIPWGNSECEYHRWKEDKINYGNPYHKKSSHYSYDPRWWRHMYNRKERAMVNNIINKARYEEDMYDDLSTKQMIKVGYYW